MSLESQKIVISRGRIMHALVVVAFVLAALSIAGQVYRFTFGRDRYLVQLFNMDLEWNIPTVFNAALLFLCAFLFSCVAWLRGQAESSFRRRWWGLAGLFFLASLDELLSFHEQLTGPVRALTGVDGLLHFAWLLPAFIVLVVLFGVYMPLFLSLSSSFKIRFGAAAAIYLLGAVGLEMIGGKYLMHRIHESLGYSLFTQVEEILELVGLLLLADSQFLYINRQFASIRIDVTLK